MTHMHLFHLSCFSQILIHYVMMTFMNNHNISSKVVYLSIPAPITQLPLDQNSNVRIVSNG